MYTLSDKNREPNMRQINMCLRVETCCNRNGQNFPVDLIIQYSIDSVFSEGVDVHNGLCNVDVVASSVVHGMDAWL